MISCVFIFMSQRIFVSYFFYFKTFEGCEDLLLFNVLLLLWMDASQKDAYIILNPLNPTFI